MSDNIDDIVKRRLLDDEQSAEIIEYLDRLIDDLLALAAFYPPNRPITIARLANYYLIRQRLVQKLTGGYREGLS